MQENPTQQQYPTKHSQHCAYTNTHAGKSKPQVEE
jgi:hypothetical protein